MRVRTTVGFSLSILIPVFILSCQSVVLDRTDSFKLTVRVTSKAGVPIEGAQCFFLDTGLDDWIAAKAEPVLVGETDASGALATELEYGWGYRVPGSEPKPPPNIEERHFSIVVRKGGYLDEARSLLLESLPRSEDGVHKVDLGTIVLTESSS